METGKIERTVRLAAAREEVWAALTQPGRLSEWFGAGHSEVELLAELEGTPHAAR